MYDDELHQLAADYANMRKDKFNEAVEKSLSPPPKYIQKLYQWLWVAHYEQPTGPRIGRDWSFWQHNEKGHVNGIAQEVDFNVFKGDTVAFKKLLIP
jgi:hypothetical protein